MKKLLAMLLCLMMLLSLGAAAFASGEASMSEEAGGEASGETSEEAGGGSGEASGGMSAEMVYPDPAENANAAKMFAQYQAAYTAAAEGIVLLENNGALPMAAGGSVALYGTGAFSTLSNAQRTVTFGDVSFIPGYADAFAAAGYEVLTDATSAASDKLSKTPDYVIYVLRRSSAEGDDRKAAEGDYYLTAAEKADLEALAETYGSVILLLNVCGPTDFYSTVLAINEKTPGGIGAILFTGIGGEGGGSAVVDVLNNTIPVSGKLADTWAMDYADYPSAGSFGAEYHSNFNTSGEDSEYYSEGIFTGYRYFDTFNVATAFAFGYGLSYTEFEISDVSVSVSDDMSAATVTAKVTNTGSTYAGREVVQVYVSYDYNGSDAAYLETAYQELAGYAKTGTLAPGASETVSVDIDLTELAAYDEATDQYVMQAGDYLLRVGSSSIDTTVAAVLRLDEKVVLKQCTAGLFEASEEEQAELAAKSLSYADIKNPELSYKSWDATGAPVIDLDSKVMAGLYEDVSSQIDPASIVTYVSTDPTTASAQWVSNEPENLTGLTEIIEAVETEPGYTLVDVYEGRITMEQLVASMDLEELADVVTGLSSEQTDKYFDADSELLDHLSITLGGYQGTKNLMTYRFIPQVFQADGPEGCGVTLSFEDIWAGSTEETETASYASIRLPSETIMAQTWDPDVVYAVGIAVGEEMLDAGLGIWLAPGCDLHRNPLCGRNMQYYSEDPLLAGTMLTAEVSGVQSNDGVFCCMKHFATNNMESNRGSVNNVITERALREIYLTPWRLCIESDSPAGAIMTAYNQINDKFCGESFDLCTALTRGEWGYDGLIMDDYTPWFFTAWRDLVKSVRVGNNLIMPGNTTNNVSSGPLGDVENPAASLVYHDVAAPFQSDSYLMMIDLEEGEMLLGEMQRSAMYILNVYMRTAVFMDIYEVVAQYGIEPSMSE